MNSSDTIYALASGAGRAGVAILRISGPDAARILAAIGGSLPRPRRASLRSLKDGSGGLLDRSLVLWFPPPASFTGEEVVELHVHGGHAIIAAVDRRLRELGARPADAGEFSRRAFLNGRMDLLEAEGLADLIDAETEGQRLQALRQSEGALTSVYEKWAGSLRDMLALQEAMLDFPDETAADAIDRQLDRELRDLLAQFADHLVDGRRAERLRTGIVICVTGEPNVGKSSLVNRLVGDDVSIVSARPGTTRDLIETRLVLAGVPVTLVDTAGLRETGDDLEAEGIRRARAKAAAAELVLEVVIGPGEWPDAAPDTLRVINKVDLERGDTRSALAVSALTGAGIAELLDALAARVRHIAACTPHPALTRSRHRSCLEEAQGHLATALDLDASDLRGEELRLAMRALGRLTGRVDVEDVLDTIFSSFCIGK